jgi:hypothetical protein
MYMGVRRADSSSYGQFSSLPDHSACKPHLGEEVTMYAVHGLSRLCGAVGQPYSLRAWELLAPSVDSETYPRIWELLVEAYSLTSTAGWSHLKLEAVAACDQVQLKGPTSQELDAYENN